MPMCAAQLRGSDMATDREYAMSRTSYFDGKDVCRGFFL